MKNIFKHFCIAVLTLAAFAACAPEEIVHPTEAGIAKASSVEPVIDVDQETNLVTFSIPAGTKAVIPVWQFQDKNGEWSIYSTRDGLQKTYASAGDYAVRMYLMNASGVSADYVEKTFHINNTIMNFDKFVTFMAGGLSDSSKEWRLDNSKPGHMGCGPSGTTGTEWWSAQADEKKAFGVYDSRMTFGSDRSYTFDPGDAGTVYVNWGVTKSQYTPYWDGTETDYNAPAELQARSFEFEVDGDDLYIVFPAGTLWPYLPNDDFIDNPRLKVESMTAKAMELISDNGGIAWHFSLTSGAAEKVFDGYKYRADSNFWKPIDDNSDFTITSMYYAHGGGWEGYPDGSMTYTQEGAKWTVNLPFESDQQWQAQFHIQPTSLPLTSAMNYDFSCIINSSTSFNGVTIKLTDNTDDGNFLFAETVEVKAFEDYVFYLTDLAGIDAANTKLVFDFGGCREGTEMVIRNIVLKDHAVDDGTVLPDVNPDGPDEPEEGAHYDVDNSSTNFWLSSGIGFTYWYSAGDWSGQLAPEYEWINGDQKDFKVVIPEGIGGSEWQGQTHFTIDHPASADKFYDFCATLNATETSTVTVKLAWEGNDNDNAFFYVNNFEVKAFEDCTFKMPNIQPMGKDGAPVDYDKIALFFDFGRTPAGTEIEIKDICFQEHQEPQGGGTEPGDGPRPGGTQIWDNSKVAISYWYSAGDWSGQLAPEISEITGGWSVVTPEGIGGSEWQGQTHFTLDAPASAACDYDFSVVLNSSVDCVVTVKLAWEGNDNDNFFFYDGNVELKAYEDVTYLRTKIQPMGKDGAPVDYDKIALFIDLGRTPAGETVEIKDISLKEFSSPVDIWDNSKVSITYWYSAGDWSGQLAPEISEITGGWSVVTPEGIGGSEWQGQTHFTLDAPASADKFYDFSLVLNSSVDCPVTVKLAWEGNDNDNAFFYEGNFQLTAYEDVTFKKSDIQPMGKDGAPVDYDKIALFVDLGRTPAGETVEIKDIHLYEK